MDDTEAFQLYPQYRCWYNKLFLSNLFGYTCGLDSIPFTDRWIIRPIQNLEGMGIGANIDTFPLGYPIPEGKFYCEVFKGRHITIDYQRVNGTWVQGATFEGFKYPNSLICFQRWASVDYKFDLPLILQTIQVPNINLELVGGKIIEVHLRCNPDPIQYKEYLPIWNQIYSSQNCPPGFKFVADLSEINLGRLGFFCR